MFLNACSTFQYRLKVKYKNRILLLYLLWIDWIKQQKSVTNSRTAVSLPSTADILFDLETL